MPWRLRFRRDPDMSELSSDVRPRDGTDPANRYGAAYDLNDASRRATGR